MNQHSRLFIFCAELENVAAVLIRELEFLCMDIFASNISVQELDIATFYIPIAVQCIAKRRTIILSLLTFPLRQRSESLWFHKQVRCPWDCWPELLSSFLWSFSQSFAINFQRCYSRFQA